VASIYLVLVGLSAILGRSGWAILSEFFGRKNIYLALSLSSLSMYLAVPFALY